MNFSLLILIGILVGGLSIGLGFFISYKRKRQYLNFLASQTKNMERDFYADIKAIDISELILTRAGNKLALELVREGYFSKKELLEKLHEVSALLQNKATEKPTKLMLEIPIRGHFVKIFMVRKKPRKSKYYFQELNILQLQTLWKSTRDRRLRKRDLRKLWIARINAAARLNGTTYAKLVSALKKANIVLNRKMLSDMALRDPSAFAAVVAKTHNRST